MSKQKGTEETGIEETLNEEVRSLAKKQHWVSYDFFHAYNHITFNDFIVNKILLVHVIREGIPYSLFNAIQLISPLQTDYWADLLDISPTSLQSYKRLDKQFKPWHSEKIIEMAEVSHLGLEVFGNKDKFKLWLETPNYALGNLSPLDLLKDSYGKELVIGELTRINYGILA
jgi:putative toxin-antitoxin system antitoxin component (TIGR02293 family)